MVGVGVVEPLTTCSEPNVGEGGRSSTGLATVVLLRVVVGGLLGFPPRWILVRDC